MAAYNLEYAEKHLAELFHDARLGEEVIIVREDGRSCALTPLAEEPTDDPFVLRSELSTEPGEPVGGDPVPA